MAHNNMKRELSEREKKFVVDMRRKNQSLNYIAAELGMSRKTLQARVKEDAQLSASIEQAQEFHLQEVGKLCKSAIKLLCKKHSYIETKEKRERQRKVMMVPRRDPESHMQVVDKWGNPVYDELPVVDAFGYPVYEMVITEQTKTKKTIMPNASVVKFAAVNSLPDLYKPESKLEINANLDMSDKKFHIMWKGTEGSENVSGTPRSSGSGGSDTK